MSITVALLMFLNVEHVDAASYSVHLGYTSCRPLFRS